MRIPDIYEHRANQIAFGRFLDACVCCTTDDALLGAIRRLDDCKIKGLGPAVANLLYFLHPTVTPPFNTAIVRGYNALTGANVRLGKWNEYLAMREGILRINAEHRGLLSNDLGALAGLLFDVGTDRYVAPPRTHDEAAMHGWEADLLQVRTATDNERRERSPDGHGDRTHTEVQGWLRDLGFALGFDVWVASNDRHRAYGSGWLSDGCLDELPGSIASIPDADSIRLIDVLWLARGLAKVEAAFEVEHTTSIYSGIMRMLDLAMGVPGEPLRGMFLVAPDEREHEVRAQLRRPAFQRVADLAVRYLPYGELAAHRSSIARFGHGLHPIEALARALP